MVDSTPEARAFADTAASRTNTSLDAVEVFDLRGEQTDPHPKSLRDGNGANAKTVKRDPKRIDSIVIHQTGIEFGVSQQQIRNANGNEELARARRALTVACHAMAFRSGIVSWPTELTWYIEHAHGLNRGSLGLEIDGHYSGLASRNTLSDGKTPTTLTDRTVAAAQAGLRLLYEEGRKIGCPIEYIFAHRQSTNKPSDPGEEIWRRVVLDYAIPVLGLKPRHEFWLTDSRGRKGKPIPVDWDPGGVGSF